MDELINLGYDLIWAKAQRDLCAYGIKFGKWEGYSDALATRKQKLKDYDSEVTRIEVRIKELEPQQKLF